MDTEDTPLNKLLRNDHGQLRNGWWILLFAAVFLVSQVVFRGVSKGLHGLGVDKAWMAPLPVVFLLGVTWICMRLRRQRLADVGLRLDARWLRQVAGGVAVGTALMLAVTGLIVAAGGVRFELDPARSAAAFAGSAGFFVGVALIEELLFRGFVFQRLVDGLGARLALALMALLFAGAHLGNPGMEGSTVAWATIDTALGALLLGLAYLRTGSLALPIGIHFGWNWAQGALLGFDVSGTAQAGWLVPHLLDKPQWLTGGAFGPEASAFSVLVDATAVLLMWRWRGTQKPPRRLASPLADAA